MEGRKAVGLVIVGLFIGSCSEHKTLIPNEGSQIAPPTTQSQTVEPEKKSDGFVEVKLMLSRNCTPCHEPGGKMYEKLPFDNAEAVRSHSSSIMRRIDKPEDKKLMEDWLTEPIN
jgi:hypothetical protein